MTTKARSPLVVFQPPQSKYRKRVSGTYKFTQLINYISATREDKLNHLNKIMKMNKQAMNPQRDNISNAFPFSTQQKNKPLSFSR